MKRHERQDGFVLIAVLLFAVIVISAAAFLIQIVVQGVRDTRFEQTRLQERADALGRRQVSRSSVEVPRSSGVGSERAAGLQARPAD